MKTCNILYSWAVELLLWFIYVTLIHSYLFTCWLCSFHFVHLSCGFDSTVVSCLDHGVSLVFHSGHVLCSLMIEKWQYKYFWALEVVSSWLGGVWAKLWQLRHFDLWVIHFNVWDDALNCWILFPTLPYWFHFYFSWFLILMHVNAPLMRKLTHLNGK